MDDPGTTRCEEAGMERRTKIVIGMAAAAAVVGLGAGMAGASDTGGGDDSPDAAITGTDLQRASDAALAETGGGEIVDSEVEEGGYEVEVDLDDGRQVEVRLDHDFAVVGSEVNEEGDDGDGD
jgi:uncharacterized membrane protein YkoI